MANLTNTAGSIVDSILKIVPLQWVLPVFFDKVLSTIKNPNTKTAKALEPALIEFGRALVRKYPGQICSED
jgi:hypothetical protein